jgi:hypothetical protein
MHAIHPLHYSNSPIGRVALPNCISPLVFSGHPSPFPVFADAVVSSDSRFIDSAQVRDGKKLLPENHHNQHQDPENRDQHRAGGGAAGGVRQAGQWTLREGAEAAGGSLPAGVRALLLRRIEALVPAAQRVLEAAVWWVRRLRWQRWRRG